jgi:error-prone DNA polymerase
MTDFAELVAASNFSFLRGASHARDLVLTALMLGLNGLGIADRNSVAGVVRAFAARADVMEEFLPVEKRREGSGPGEFVRIEPYAGLNLPCTLEELGERAKKFKLAYGARLVFCDGTPDIVAYAQTRAGWAQLCRLLTKGNMKKRVKGLCELDFGDLMFRTEGLALIVLPERINAGLDPVLSRLARVNSGNVWLGARVRHDGQDKRRLADFATVAARHGTPLIATNDVLYHAPEQRDVQDILTCIREGVTIDAAGTLLEANAERHLKSTDEMARLFRDYPDAVAQTQILLDTIDFDLDQLRYEYPEEPIPPDWSAQSWLTELTWRRAAMRYPDGVPDKVTRLIEDELKLIDELGYAAYFLTINDIVRKAEDLGILCQGRGSAANSAVCYVLGITSVDPATNELLFARFLSKERREPPDIDVDFEHERREEIIQYIYSRYGRQRAGIAATVISYRPRSAIREVGKALGLTEDITARIASTVWGSWSSEKVPDKHIEQTGLNPNNPAILRAVVLATRILGFPRHLSQHVGGFVLTQGRLDEYVPIGWAAMDDRSFIEWDKDDIDRVGMLKVDVLALGMLTCIRKAFELIAAHHGEIYDLANVPDGDEEVYAMLQRGESIGVFQVESRAQINMLPRLRPEKFYDLVIQVAIVRPGPIQGNMVHPYLRRRSGEEEVEYPKPGPPHDPDELRKVLGRTLGVPLFQEQAMKIAMVAAEFTDTEANGLRKAMATFRNSGTIGRFENMMVKRMIKRGYDPEFAQRCFDQIKGFGEYGFPESHAASFARLVYISAYIKHYYPAVFAAALLNSQPMGFYAPAQIVGDARNNGVEVRPADVNASFWDNTLEDTDKGPALRLGLRQIDGFQKQWAERIVALRGAGLTSLEQLWQRSGLPHRAFRLLADADALDSLGLDRREAAWAVRRLPADEPLPLFAAARADELGEDEAMALPVMPLAEHVIADYQTVRLSLKSHPMAFLREKLDREGVVSCKGLERLADGAQVRVAGVVLIRQRPGKGNAVFITLEDETGICNGLVWARDFEEQRRAIMSARLAVLEGVVQKSKENVVHVMTKRVIDHSELLDGLARTQRSETGFTRADEIRPPRMPRGSHPRNARIVPKSRDFH